jgi:hypothetical protein
MDHHRPDASNDQNQGFVAAPRFDHPDASGAWTPMYRDAAILAAFLLIYSAIAGRVERS